MNFLFALLTIFSASAQYDSLCGCCGGCNNFGGWNGCNSGFGCGCGWLSGSELSSEELDSLCCGGCCYPDGCCYELCDDCFSDELCHCSPCASGFGACGNFAPACQSFQPNCQSFQSFQPSCNSFQNVQPACGYAQPVILQQQPICRAPAMFNRQNNMNSRNVAGNVNANCANVHGAGQNNCGYNQGNICGSAGAARMNADACRRHGDRHFANKCADEFLVRRCNEGCATGNDCYDTSRANMCASANRLAGNKACGNANSCHNNAAGMKSNSLGICGNANCCRSGMSGCGSPCAC